MEIGDIIQNICGTDCGYDYHPLPVNDPLQRCPDLTKIKKLGWSANIRSKWLSKNNKIFRGRDMKILVTGRLGYIGSHTCKYLSLGGHELVTFDNLSRGNAWAEKYGPNYLGDLKSIEDIRQCFKQFGPFDAVIHFAALAYVGESVIDPNLYFDNNVKGTMNLLDVMSEENCNRLVFSSSCAVYGTPTELPVAEHAPLVPTSPYGLSKLICENHIRYHALASNCSSICLRYFNVIGSDPDSDVGEEHNPEPHILPNLIDAAINKTEFRLYGDDYPTDDGTNIRDYIDVNDLAKLHIIAMDNCCNSRPGHFDTINVGTGVGHSNLELIRTVESVLNCDLNIKIEPRRPGDAVALRSKIDKMRSELPLEDGFVPLAESVRTAYNWKRKYYASK